jgi:GABA permease
MAPRRLLVVTTVPDAGEAVRERVRRHAGDADAELRVVAPAADVSPLQWLANDEDAARAEAAEAASRTADAVAGEARVETEVGDSDPVKAIEDALRTFPADEVIVVTPAGERANWLESGAGEDARDRFDVPVTEIEL